MVKKRKSAFLAALLCLSFSVGSLFGMGVSATDEVVREVASVAEVAPTSRISHLVTLTHASGTTLTPKGAYIDGKLFVPLGDFAKSFTNATYTYDARTKYATLKANGLYLTAGVGGTFLTANDRCFYGVAANRVIDGQVWVPIAPLAKAMSLSVSYANGATTARVSGTYRALAHASVFYNESELYWLSRIISAESKGEPLRGQIAVGNVILNRVRSKSFPNTIYGVIFQKNQFSPVLNGTIYNSPAWTSVCAAKLCLEGYSISNDVLFFCNLSITSSNWITKNRQVAFKLGNHTFFY